MLCIENNEVRNMEEPIRMSDEDLTNLVCSFIDQYAGLKRQQVTGYVSQQEAASWVFKLAQAQAYQAGQPAPMIQAEATARNMSEDELASRVIANSLAYQYMEPILCGIAGKHRDIVKSLPTREDVVNYDWREGWPI